MFRELNPEEEEDFRTWARRTYEAGTPISDVWHPVIKDECRKINEASLGKEMTRKVLIDGQEVSADRVEVIYTGVFIPGEDDRGSLHVNLTSEGIIMDVWGWNTQGLDTNFGTSSQLVEDIVDELCEENQ